jgi:hypothetical protein
VAKNKRKIWIGAGIALFLIYVFASARPIPEEIIIKPRWLSSLESNYPVILEQGENGGPKPAIPFTLGGRFGYVDSHGYFPVNQAAAGSQAPGDNLSFSENYWAQYGAKPEFLEIMNSEGRLVMRIENSRGYPLFLDDKIFILGYEQNSLSALDENGNILWTYDFAAPLTCIDAAAGFVLAGSLDGAIEVLDSGGKRIFFFEPGGSRLSVVTGCAMSRDASRLGIVSGIDDQRFLLLERFGDTSPGEYKVVYHEFLDDGFRRPVYIYFIDGDSRIIFERSEGLGVYSIDARSSVKIPLEGDIAALEHKGSGGFLFVITSQSSLEKKLVAIRLPGTIELQAPFKSDTVFLEREGSRLYVGGGMTLASFELEKR